MNNKKAIRADIKSKLSKLSKPLYEDYSLKIAREVYKDEDWAGANVIGITISNFPEVDTYQIIRKAWEQGKKVVVPKCYPLDKKMSFRSLTEFSQLESVFYGLLEPKEDQTNEVKPEKIDLLIVPGLAFTKEGNRLGFGGGYYDRYLKQFSGKTLSLAFTEQIIPQFTIESHDIPVSKIITNDKVMYIK